MSMPTSASGPLRIYCLNSCDSQLIGPLPAASNNSSLRLLNHRPTYPSQKLPFKRKPKRNGTFGASGSAIFNFIPSSIYQITLCLNHTGLLGLYVLSHALFTSFILVSESEIEHLSWSSNYCKDSSLILHSWQSLLKYFKF